ncbi:MAG: KTSC domain-containing protein [Flavobacteriales bacterium AspAUS03]
MSNLTYKETFHVFEAYYHSGFSYQYYDMPDHVAEALREAPSKGRFIHRNIKRVLRILEDVRSLNLSLSFSKYFSIL